MMIYLLVNLHDHDLIAHFLNVGDGDCTIIELPDGNIMMVDIMNGRRDRSHNLEYENPIHYLRNIPNATSIYRYIQTHPDMDHMDGFADLLQTFDIVNFWDTENTKKKPDEFTNSFREIDWDAYKTSPKGKILQFNRRTESVVSTTGPYVYNIYPISPTKALTDTANEGEDWNSLSYAILLHYKGFKLLLGGDVTTTVWEDIAQWIIANPTTAGNLLSGINVFRTSHHGRGSGYCGNPLLKFFNPQVIISDNSAPSTESANAKYEYFLENREGGVGNMHYISDGTIVCKYDKNTNQYRIQ